MRLAVFTLVRNEQFFFPTWLQHYRMYVLEPADIYVLDHGSSGDALDTLMDLRQVYPFNYVPVDHHLSYSTTWMARVTADFQKFLLRSYDAVLFSAADEIVAPTPESQQTLLDVCDRLSDAEPYFRCNAFEVVHKHDEEPALVYKQPWLPQRTWWYHSPLYSKPLLSSIPLHWKRGWFGAYNVPADLPVRRDLLSIHLHKIDYQRCIERHQQVLVQRWDPHDRTGPLAHNLLEDPEKLSRWILSLADDSSQYAQLHRIPDSVKREIPCRSVPQ